MSLELPGLSNAFCRSTPTVYVVLSSRLCISIVSDFVRYARSVGIPVGPGRGSAAGSMVSYCLHITDIDPIPYSLYFERFLNPERVSMPDIDMDFGDTRRGEVVEYVRRKYGEDHVAQMSKSPLTLWRM